MQEDHSAILDQLAKELKGIAVFLINKVWLDDFKYFAKGERYDRPSPIDNFPLVKLHRIYETQRAKMGPPDLLKAHENFFDWKNMELRRDIQEERDFVVISHTSWLMLIGKFGGGPAIELSLINGKPDLNPIRVIVVNTGMNNTKTGYGMLMSENSHLHSFQLMLGNNKHINVTPSKMEIEVQKALGQKDANGNPLLGIDKYRLGEEDKYITMKELGIREGSVLYIGQKYEKPDDIHTNMGEPNYKRNENTNMHHRNQQPMGDNDIGGADFAIKCDAIPLQSENSYNEELQHAIAMSMETPQPFEDADDLTKFGLNYQASTEESSMGNHTTDHSAFSYKDSDINLLIQMGEEAINQERIPLQIKCLSFALNTIQRLKGTIQYKNTKQEIVLLEEETKNTEEAKL